MATSATEIEQAQQSEGRWSLDDLLVGLDADARKAIVGWTAYVIEHANALSPNCWVVTRRGRRLRVDVGRNVCFEFRPPLVVGLGLHMPSYTGPAEAIPAVKASKEFEFVDVPDGILRRISLAAFLAEREALKAASNRFIEESAAAFPNTPFARYHAADLLDEIEAAHGSPLPRPKHRAVSPRRRRVPVNSSGTTDPNGVINSPSALDELLAQLEADKLHFPADTLASYLLSLQAKRFVILSGISGTGKTQLALAVAKAFQPARVSTTIQASTYELVAVRPDWTDNRGLLGYLNPITREYQTTAFLNLLMRAGEEYADARRAERPPVPYFVILDEMNLARVEHYFSDFLSALESGEPLALHDDPEVEQSTTNGQVPRRLSVPPNLYFTGTVNVDETTYMFSPKVLDRAFVLEFNEVDLIGFGDGRKLEASVLELRDFVGLSEIEIVDEAWSAFRELLEGELYQAVLTLNERLELDHRHFGYRVAKEIARFVVLAAEQGDEQPEMIWHALDIAVLSKVLPKLHGTQQEIADLLARLFAFAIDVEAPVDMRAAEADWNYAKGRLSRSGSPPQLPRAAAKLWRMLRRVRLQGYVSFIE
jgi:5-methylcytosine-specific restriction protein B